MAVMEVLSDDDNMYVLYQNYVKRDKNVVEHSVVCLIYTLVFQCQHDNEQRMKKLESYKTEEGKRKRVQRKVDRAEEQKLRYIKVLLFFRVLTVRENQECFSRSGGSQEIISLLFLMYSWRIYKLILCH